MGRASVRYIVADVDAAVSFYTELLGFQLEMQRGTSSSCSNPPDQVHALAFCPLK